MDIGDLQKKKKKNTVLELTSAPPKGFGEQIGGWGGQELVSSCLAALCVFVSGCLHKSLGEAMPLLFGASWRLIGGLFPWKTPRCPNVPNLLLD